MGILCRTQQTDCIRVTCGGTSQTIGTRSRRGRYSSNCWPALGIAIACVAQFAGTPCASQIPAPPEPQPCPTCANSLKVIEPLISKRLSEYEKEYGPYHPEVANMLLVLGNEYRKGSQYMKAMPALQRALQIRSRNEGKDSPAACEVLAAIGGVYVGQEQYAKAESVLTRAVTGLEKVGSASEFFAMALHELGCAYFAERSFDKALPLFIRSLATNEREFGPNSPALLGDLFKLQWLYREQRKYAQSEPYMRRYVAICVKTFGGADKNIIVNWHMEHLALLYEAEKKYSDAEHVMKQVVANKEKLLRHDDPGLAYSLLHYAQVLKSTNHRAEAERLEARARAILSRNSKHNPGSSGAADREKRRS